MAEPAQDTFSREFGARQRGYYLMQHQSPLCHSGFIAAIEAIRGMSPAARALFALAALPALVLLAVRKFIADFASAIADALSSVGSAFFDILVAAATLIRDAEAESMDALACCSAAVRPRDIPAT